MALSRREAREILLGLVFQFLFLEEAQNIAYKEMLANDEIDKESKEFIKEIYDGVCRELEGLTEIIKANVKDFSPSQVFKLDYAILLIACFEVLHAKQDAAVAINEAIVLAKKFSTDKSGGFINGVLSSIIKNKDA